MKPAVAWIGLGRMGEPMAANLLKAGFPLTVHNRSPEPAARLAALGAAVAETPHDAAHRGDLVFLMLPTPDTLNEIMGGPDGVAVGLRPGSLLIDMGTDGVEAVKRADLVTRGRGAALLDAPVLGSRGPAKAGTLVVMAGGETGDLDRARPCLSALARFIHHVGPVGAGQAMKLSSNLMLAHMLTGLASALALARASGLEPRDLLAILEEGIGSPYIPSKGGQMLAGNTEPQFTIETARKDVRLIRQALHAAGVGAPTMEPIEEMLAEAIRRGWGNEDGAALLRLWES